MNIENIIKSLQEIHTSFYNDFLFEIIDERTKRKMEELSQDIKRKYNTDFSIEIKDDGSFVISPLGETKEFLKKEGKDLKDYLSQGWNNENI